MNLLVTPSCMAEVVPRLAELRSRFDRIIGASSIANNLLAPLYDVDCYLPYVSDSRFGELLEEIVARHEISHIYVPNNTVWYAVESWRKAKGADVALFDELPQRQHQRTSALWAALGENLALSRPVYEHPNAWLASRRLAIVAHAYSIYGATDLEKLLAMLDIAPSVVDGDFIEVGVLGGRSAYVLRCMAAAHGALLCIDPWQQAAMEQQRDHLELVNKVIGGNRFDLVFRSFLHEMHAFPGTNFNYLRSRSSDAYPIYASGRSVVSPEFGETMYVGRISFLHIDGNHDFHFVSDDINSWGRHLVPGGWMVVDDYHWAMGDGPRRAADNWLSRNGSRVDVAFVAGGALFIRLL